MPAADPNSRRRALIVEQNSTGHRLFYVRLLAEAAVERGDEVVLLLNDGQDSEAEQVHLGSLLQHVRIVRRELASLDEVAALSRELGADQVVVPDGDRLALRLALRASWAGAGVLSILIMRETARSSASPVASRLKSIVRTAAFRRVAAMQRVRLIVLKSAAWRGKSSFAVAVDPIVIDGGQQAVASFRDDVGISDDRYWFAVLGAISARKNLPLILDALEQSTAPVGLLVAGQMDESVSRTDRGRLTKLVADGRAVVLDRLLSDAELDAAVAAVDCVVLAHSNEGPSGLLGKAAAVGSRVVAAGAQSLRRDVEGLPTLGEWVPLNVRALAAAFDRASSSSRPPALLQATSSAFTSALLQ